MKFEHYKIYIIRD